MNKIKEPKNFIASAFGDNAGHLTLDEVRYIRNFSNYYQKVFSLLDNEQEQSYDFIRAGHHGSWQTIFASSHFFSDLWKIENEARSQKICQWLTLQGWAKFEVLHYSDQLASYQVLSNSMHILEKYFLQGMVLSAHCISRLQDAPEIHLDYLDEVLQKNLSLMQEQNDSNEKNSIYKFTIS